MLKYRNSIPALLLSAVLAACSNSSQTGETESAAAVYPAGVAPFKNSTAAFNAGLYTTSSIHGCCFLKQRAKVTLEKPAGARIATLNFFVPDAAPLKSGETVTVSVAGAGANASATASGVAGKWIAISLAFPPRYIARTSVPIEIAATKSFVPEKIGMSNDGREYSVVLQRVDYP
jgi:hypothetical protein